MLFSSIPFVFLFLPLSLVGYFLCAKFLATSGKLVWLALASVGFYAYWRVDYLPILLGSIVVNFAIASAIQIQVERSGSRQKLAYFLLFIGVAFNLGLLGYFKYFNG